jgi:hypothetical protein
MFTTKLVTAPTDIEAKSPINNGFNIDNMLPRHHVDDYQQQRYRKSGQASYDRLTLEFRLGRRFQHALCPSDESANGDRSRQEAGGDGGLLEDHACERNDRCHTPSLPSSDARVVRQM